MDTNGSKPNRLTKDDLERHLKDVEFLHSIQVALQNFSTGNVRAVAIAIDGKAPMKPMQIELLSNEHIDIAQKMLEQSAMLIRKRLIDAGIEP